LLGSVEVKPHRIGSRFGDPDDIVPESVLDVIEGNRHSLGAIDDEPEISRVEFP
jgi:hypothetical protein